MPYAAPTDRQRNGTLAAQQPRPDDRTWRWRKLSAAYRRQHPLCAECERNGFVTRATEVDHIVPRAQGGKDCTDNLQSLCKSCHAKKTRSEA